MTIYNKKLLGGPSPPPTIAAIGRGEARQVQRRHLRHRQRLRVRRVLRLRAEVRLGHPRPAGQRAKTPGDGDVLATDVAQGGFTTAVFESGLVRGGDQARQPALVGWEYTTDYTPLIPRGIGITAGAASPDSAKLFMNYLFSNAGQAAACDGGFEAYSNTFTATNGCTRHPEGPVHGHRQQGQRRAGARSARRSPTTRRPFVTRWKQAFTTADRDRGIATPLTAKQTTDERPQHRPPTTTRLPRRVRRLVLPTAACRR